MEDQAKVNILIVDDQAANLILLEGLLQCLEQNIIKARSGEKALEQLRRQEFAVILLDVNMPQMNGFELAEHIRADAKLQTTPIIFLTGMEQSEISRFRGYELGAVDYLVKPIDSKILISKIKVFINLFQQRDSLKQQTQKLNETNARLEEQIRQFQQLEKELKHINANLETIVEQRTAELLKKTATLEAEIEKRHYVEKVLRSIALGFSAATGESFFSSLVEELAQAIGLDYVILGEFNDSAPLQLKTIAIYSRNFLEQTAENIPVSQLFKKTIDDNFCFYKFGLLELFPADTFVQSMGFESYIGTKLTDSQGKGVGLLCGFAYQPIAETSVREEIVQLFAVRCGLELERERQKQELEDSEELHRLVITSISDALFLTDLQGNFTFVCPNISVIFGYSETEIQQQGNIEYLLPAKLFDVEQLKSQKEIANIEVDIFDKNFCIHYLLIKVKLVNIHGEKILYTCRDITTIKKMQAALNAEQEKFRQIVTHTSDGIIVVDSRQEVAFINPAAERLWGCKSSELYGSSINLSLEDDQRELCFSDSNGELVSAEIKAVEINWSGENACLITLREITERKQYEIELRRSVRELSDIKYALDKAAIVIITDGDGRIHYANEKFCQISQYSWKETKGNNPRMLNSGYHRRQFFSQLWATISRGDIWRGEIKNKAKDGSYFWVDTTIIPFLNENGVPWQYLAISFNITDQKLAENSLRESEQRYRQLIYNLATGVVVHNPDTGIVLYNSRACEILEMTGEQILGKKATDPNWQFLREDKTVLPLAEYPVNLVITNKKPLENYFVGLNCPASKRIKWVLVNAFPYFDSQDNLYQVVVTFVDITDRKEAEEKLKRSEEQFRQMAENIRDVFFIHDAHSYQILYLSPAFEKIWGISRESVYQDPLIWANLVHPDDLQRVMAKIKSEQQGNPCQIEYRIVKPDGTISWIRSRTFPVFDELGNLSRIVGLGEDITGRKLTEQALAESQLRYETLAKAAPVGIFRCDIQGNCLYVNEKLQLMGGLNQEQSLGTGWLQAIHPDDSQTFIQQWHNALDHQISFWGEYRFQSSQGLTSWVFVQVVPETDGHGNVTGYVGTITDISDRKKAEIELQQLNEKLEIQVQERTQHLSAVNEQLRQEIWEREQAELALRDHQAFLSNVINALPQFIFVKDWEGRYCLANLAVAKAYGTTIEQVEGKTDYDFHPKEHYEEIKALDDENRMVISSAKASIRMDVPVTLINGEVRHYQSTKLPIIAPDGKSVRVLGVANDITEIKKAEREIEKALEKEREINQLKNHFIDIVSHEFRTPLTSIVGYAEFLQRHGDKLTQEKKQRQLHHILSAGERLTQLIGDVLSLSRADSGKLQFNPLPINLADFCQELIEEMSMGMGKQHRLKFIDNRQENGGESELIHLDEKLLRHILTNLLSNAVKYSPEGSEVELVVQYKNDKVEFLIKDQGIGIPLKEQSGLFDPFYRASNVGTIPGTGLGLNIVKKYVELHGGIIQFTSEEGVGTTFNVSLPLVKTFQQSSDDVVL